MFRRLPDETINQATFQRIIMRDVSGRRFSRFLKSEPAFEKAYVASLGKIFGAAAEDWIIEQHLKQEYEQ